MRNAHDLRAAIGLLLLLLFVACTDRADGKLFSRKLELSREKWKGFPLDGAEAIYLQNTSEGKRLLFTVKSHRVICKQGNTFSDYRYPDEGYKGDDYVDPNDVVYDPDFGDDETSSLRPLDSVLRLPVSGSSGEPGKRSPCSGEDESFEDVFFILEPGQEIFVGLTHFKEYKTGDVHRTSYSIGGSRAFNGK